MSVSPPIRRLSTSSSSREDLIYQYEAEEERIINILSRKLEQLREEKIELENVLEAESESHVNKLNRELSALRLAQQQQQQQASPSLANGSGTASPTDIRPTGTQRLHLFSRGNGDPSSDAILDALRRENESLRSRLVETEQDFIRISRLNEMYREELIQHRRRLGLPVDNLIGLPQSDPFSQPTHRRSSFTSGSPSTSIHIPSNSRRASAVPIPRPPSQIRRPANIISESSTPLSHSPSSASTSPFPFSPVNASPFPASYTSAITTLTTPPSIGSVAVSPPTFTVGGTAQMLSYPLVPPPSLSSSFGSPSTSLHHPIPLVAARDHEGTPSPVESFHSRRNSVNRRGSFDRRIVETGNLRSVSHSRRESVERGARIAETGSLVPRSRADSLGLGLPETIEDADQPPPQPAGGTDASGGTRGGDGFADAKAGTPQLQPQSQTRP